MRLEEIAKERWTVYAVCEDNGDSPVLSFLEGLDEETRRKVVADFDVVASHGPDIHNPLKFKKIQGYDKLFEYKRGPRRGPGVRILFFYDAGRVIICTNGFMKASQKTPKQELERAEAWHKRYIDWKARRDK